MKACIIVPSIRRFEFWPKYAANFKEYGHESDVYVIDEEYGEARDNNRALMGDEVEFFGLKERVKWFLDRGLQGDVIPMRSHAETSFGLLLAYEGDYDMAVFVDDDTYPWAGDFLGTHWKALNGVDGVIASNTKWINVTDSYYPRGYPYGERLNPTYFAHEREDKPSEFVLNQGLWTKVPDMNALDILARGGLDGRTKGKVNVDGNFAVDYGNYATVCSMNLAFRPEIIPAFYQLYMSREAPYGIDRFDDIWSGVFLKKILDHLGKGMSYGYPLCVHDKYPRDVFKDVKAEMEGVIINETLWKVVDEVELTERDYLNCYRELTLELLGNKGKFHLPDYIEFMCRKMIRWVKLIEKLEP